MIGKRWRLGFGQGEVAGMIKALANNGFQVGFLTITI
jgi:hypothetical protein